MHMKIEGDILSLSLKVQGGQSYPRLPKTYEKRLMMFVEL